MGSMTREKAIKALRIEGIEIGGKANRLAEFMMALDAAQKALRPVSREQVEKMWSGCEYCTGDVNDRSYLDSKRLYLDENGILTDEIENIDILRLSFCPVCGKPLTDEAVDMMLERWKEAVE